MALEQRVVCRVYGTVNPLVYKVRVDWGEPLKADAALMVWNLFQKWAANNDGTPSGRVDWRLVPSPYSGDLFTFGFVNEVHLKERLGPLKDDHP